jgi:hypothetical protein
MDEPSWPIDSPNCRIDLIRKAAESSFGGDFNWIEDKEALRVTTDPRNRGFTALEIREPARAWIRGGGEIRCVPEERENRKHRRHFHCDIVIDGIDEFPRGLYVELELTEANEEEPEVSLLNAHPASFP